MLFRTDIGIDLGTSSVLVYVKGKGIILEEPSVVAIDQYNDSIVAVGEEARRMLGRTPGNIVAIRPMKDGVISNYDITQRMLKYFIKKTVKQYIFKPRLVICVPSGVTDVERRAVIEASNNLGINKVSIIEEPIAAAIGAGIDITEAYGNMIVDIGGGTTDIAVIALGGIVVNKSIKVAGNKFDDAIVRYIRKEYNMMIGERSAENLKHSIGSVFIEDEERFEEIKGRDLQTGLPKKIELSNKDLYQAIKDPMEEIIIAIKQTLEKTPPELAADIADRGIIVTGGGALLNGVDKLISERTGIDVNIVSNPTEATVRGTGRALKWVDVLK